MTVLQRPFAWRPIALSASAVAIDVALGFTLRRLIPAEGHYSWVLVRGVQVVLAGITIDMLLRTEGARIWAYAPAGKDWQKLFAGVLAGTIANSAMFLTLAKADWLRSPTWGWQIISVPELSVAIFLGMVGEAAVSVHEELLTRGYPFDTLSQSVGTPLAGIWMTFIFAIRHEWTPLIFIGQFALGAALMLLRHYTGSMWASIGYHWAWNVLQTAILGPTDLAPSLRPVEVLGPPVVVGRPGHPEPGLLAAAINGAVALVLGAMLWRRQRS